VGYPRIGGSAALHRIETAVGPVGYSEKHSFVLDIAFVFRQVIFFPRCKFTLLFIHNVSLIWMIAQHSW